jgi:PPM family protein phosphatase
MSSHLLHIAMGYHRGLRRQANEDAIAYEYPTTYEVLQQRGVLISLADGVASVSGGAVASETALARLISIYYTQPDYMNCKNGLLDAIKKVNAELHQLYAGSSTTLVAAVIHENHLIVAHAGDSRAYWLHGDTLKQVTNDHTVDVLQASGKVKSKLKRAIGYLETIDVDINEMLVDEGDTILLVSDGVTRYLNHEELRQWLQVAPVEAVRGMIQAANQAGGYDNSSAVVVRVGAKIEAPYKLAIHLAEMQPNIMVDIPDVALPTKHITQEVAIPHEPLDDDELVEAEPAQRTAWYSVRTIISLLIAGTILMYFMVSKWITAHQLPTPTVTDVPATQPIIATNTQVITITPSATQAPTQTATDLPTVTASATTVPTLEQGLLIGTQVQFDAQAVTYARINQPTTALVISPQRIYRVQDIVIDADNKKWYRLYDTLIELDGWIQQENLPPYHIID